LIYKLIVTNITLTLINNLREAQWRTPICDNI